MAYWEKYSYVMASKHRKKVLLSLLDHPKMPTQIGEETGLRVSHVSRALREMTSKGITTCLTPEVKKGRIYALTNDGKKIGKSMRKAT